ncbi:hypothetical protein [Lysobacter humi (ex Lee et al. 2017)]
MRIALPVLALWIASTVPVAPAVAQVRRCALADGTTVYTDRRCDSLGAVEQKPSAPGAAQLRNHRAACPRTLRDLAFEVSAAIESKDVNRLAAVYHWPGMSTSQGYAQMARLQAIVDRPLVDLQPIYAGQSADEPYPPIEVRRAPIGLRVEQVSRGGSTPVRAVLGLRKHLDCWWVTEGGLRRVPPPPVRGPNGEIDLPDTGPQVPVDVPPAAAD